MRFAPAFAIFFFAAPAFADKDACITAYEQTQTLRKDGKLVQARAQAAICMASTCPALLSKDCTKWHGELETQTPSLLVESNVEAAKVKVDGNVVAEKVDGKAVSLDPGSHVVRLEPEGAPAVEKTVVLKEGDRNHKVAFEITKPPPSEKAATETPTERPVPTAAWIFGGVAVASLATAGVFALDGLAKKSDLDGCKPHCSADDVDSMSARFTLADVALGAGVVAAAAAIYLVVTRPETRPSGKEAAFWVLPGGAGGRF